MTAAGTDIPERDREILALFIEESFEDLQHVEKLLLDAEGGTTAPDLLDRVFRVVHTVKGTSAYLNLRKIASLSHAAEDLLATLREGVSRAHPPHVFARLVDVVDVLRRLIRCVQETDEEGDLDVDELANRLRADAASVQAMTGSVPPALAVTAPDTVHPAPALAPPPSSMPAAPPLSALPALDLVGLEPAVFDLAQATDPVDPLKDTAGTAKSEGHDSSVRVNLSVLDRLMNLMGELVLARNQIVQTHKTGQGSSVGNPAALQRLSVVTSEMQEQIMKTRMQPIARVFERIPRMVRDLCQATGKKVTCHIDGNATEIDKAVVEAVRDPLMHLVRNSIDHGIELPGVREQAGKSGSGVLGVRARHEGGMVLIEITDDGRGMDPKKLREHAIRRGIISAADAGRLSDREALELIYRPGFSTAEKVTDISGRGVGMDVARTQIERAGGQIELDSAVGRGTTVRLKMPLTLAIIPALLVRARGQRFAIPQANLLELVFLNDEQARASLEHVRGAEIYRLRGEVLPLVRLRGVLTSKQAALPTEGVSIVVVAVGTYRYGLVVDHIDDTEEIVIKPLHGPLKRLACYSGATVLGNGEVALILDVAGVAAAAGVDVSARQTTRTPSPRPQGRGGVQTMLVFRAGADTLCAVQLAIVARLELATAKSIEFVGEREVLQYRQTIMPLVRPEGLLPLGDAAPQDPQELVVFDFGQMVGMPVRQIVDIVEVDIDTAVPSTVSELVLGEVVIFGRTALWLDVYELLRLRVPSFIREPQTTRRQTRLVVADRSTTMRSALAGFLRARGAEVLEVASAEAALKELRTPAAFDVDAVVTDLPTGDTGELETLQALRREKPGLPVVVWTHHDDPELRARAMAAGARHCVSKRERASLLAALGDCGLPLGGGGGAWAGRTA